MAKKITAWKTKGMNRDLSVSAFNPEFAFENRNLRLATNDNNTLLSWVNEKGTQSVTINWETSGVTGIVGHPIGTAVLNHYIVLFTTGNTSSATSTSKSDYIYRFTLNEDGTTMTGRQLFKGNLNFSTKAPLETLAAYEADHIQKVYWTDGRNQPRLINIVRNAKLAKYNQLSDAMSASEIATFFDFVPSLEMKEKVNIANRPSTGGIFAPGVIQYCFTYINKYGQQSNIVYVSPIYFLAFTTRGASPEEKVSNTFKIEITNFDTTFDYIRLYSIQRTSINATPFVKLLEDLSITGSSNGKITFIDNGTKGATMDPTELLYVGGKEISALTMADKDNTLFLGNIAQKNIIVDSIQDYYLAQKEAGTTKINFQRDDDESEYDPTDYPKVMPQTVAHGIYTYDNQLDKNHRRITTFKGGETYRLGFQLQKYTGEWSEPIYLDDVENPLYPHTELPNYYDVYPDFFNLVYAKSKLSVPTNLIDRKIYKKIRPMVVFPTIGDRTVLCQGVLNPTVFNNEDRKTKSPYAQASWFFRPYVQTYTNETPTIDSSVVSSVTDHADTSSADISIDSNYAERGFTEVYALVCYMNLAEAADILSRPYITITDREKIASAARDYTKTTNHVYLGAIKLTHPAGHYPDGWNYYAFLSLTEWPEPYVQTTTAPGDEVSRKYPSQMARISISATKFKLYSEIKVSQTDHRFYYKQPRNTGPTDTQWILYKFRFYMENTNPEDPTFPKYWVVQFTSMGIDMGDDDNDFVDRGAELPFTHYESLICQGYEDRIGTDEDNKRIEIQGSTKVYDNPYDKEKYGEENGLDVQTNSQFFVDQSIVTLNSPDIEFDTEVQNYPTEGLSLHIVGAIPLTATACSHSISIASNMLNAGYNTDAPVGCFGKGELDDTVTYMNHNSNAGKRLIADYLWNDTIVYSNPSEDENAEKIATMDLVEKAMPNYLIHPWQKIGSLNNDFRSSSEASSVLKTKKESTLLYSANSVYIDAKIPSTSRKYVKPVHFDDLSAQVILTENAEVMNYRLPAQKDGMSEINYYPNIDKVLYSSHAYQPLKNWGVMSADEMEKINQKINEKRLANLFVNVTGSVSMKYKSTSHMVIALNGTNVTEGGSTVKRIPILPYAIIRSFHIGEYEHPVSGDYKTFWGDDNVQFTQEGIDTDVLFRGEKYETPNYKGNLFNILWLAELHKKTTDKFGGLGKEAIRSNSWLVGGDAVDLTSSQTVDLIWTEGDTYYQRYDCLKTYPFTEEDNNQNTELLSFMCETHVNIDGRWDRNRGQFDNTTMNPMKNFNQINDVYSQQDNFFSYRNIEQDAQDKARYPNMITFTKTKTSGADVDLWTNLTLASSLELDGNKGEISSLNRLNNQIISFQDSGISQVLYNETVQISSTEGVPIEIANSNKVQGKRYYSNNIGCTNKWSVLQTPSGIYFIDSNDKSIYLFNGQLANLSLANGMNPWIKENLQKYPDVWNPVDFNGFVSYYDKINQDVFFINKDTALAFSERLGTFTSFYDYGNTPYFCNLDDTGIWVRGNGSLWKHQAGSDYCKFFDTQYPFSMILVGNPEPQMDKIFTNLEFRANVDGEGSVSGDTFTPLLPFNSLETWNEYQHGITTLSHRNGHSAYIHHSGSDSSLKRKFRIWRCDIPRDNAALALDAGKNIKRFAVRPIDRMRNPWLYIKLMKNANNSNVRTEIHDLVMTYFD